MSLYDDFSAALSRKNCNFNIVWKKKLGKKYFILLWKSSKMESEWQKYDSLFPALLWRLTEGPRSSVNNVCFEKLTVVYPLHNVGRVSSVGIATHYGLDGPGIESRWGRNFPHPSRPALGPTSSPINWFRISFPGVKRPGRSVDHLPLSSAEVKERVELYLYSPSGSSWLALGWNLPLPLHCITNCIMLCFTMVVYMYVLIFARDKWVLVTTVWRVLRLRMLRIFWISSREQPIRRGPPAWVLGEVLTNPRRKNVSSYETFIQ